MAIAIKDKEGRVCTNCGSYKPWSQFHKNASSRTGFMTECKICKNQRDRNRRAKKKGLAFEEEPKEFNIDNSITISELAKRWGVSVNTMENYVYRGRCPNYYKLGHGIKFDLDDVREYENENYFVTKKRKNSQKSSKKKKD